MNLSNKIWKEFSLNNLFDIKPGIYHYPEEYDEGETAYVSASNTNNGIKQRINLKPDFKGNCIVTGKVGCTAFYQYEDFCATSDVNILTPQNFQMNEDIGLFFVTIINFSENYKWNYGRQCRVSNSKKIIINLPVVSNNERAIIDKKKIFSEEGYIPDFEFMKNYIKSLKGKPITTKNSRKNKLSIFNRKWEEFKLGNLFSEIYKGKPHIKGELYLTNSTDAQGINFISRTDTNNGCDAYVLDKNLKNIEHSNAITIGDTTATVFYQNQRFVTGDHIVVCRAKWMNKYTALFMKTIIDTEKYKYSYGRAFKMNLIKNTVIKLPAKNDSEPDWELIEDYVKSLPFADRI
ncbi:hypothetical protein BUY15_11085 [Staphylococcus chromogenes]|uniref:Type I restriction modification DNA specificity domain-containing protein n=2 Tax=Staphylococcus TaxID=1279 RepID=F8WKH4_STAAU|nr:MULTISPECIES: restriction endonuclease subunit S [Staphylococcus]KAA28172.1 hypothetical protein W409_02237 [Staphylococcus aureus VET0075R]KAA35186.1 hypothetical protein W410_02253 [Staphylococcus aureus VET0076R]KAE28280.1 hypothetical protein W605_02205 [Staphylococcus aureus VET0357R]KAG69375.1 hypothetical protein W780_02151 [Staphylococcus aureus VET1168S]KAG82092.1 hypothetical protein W789_02073 [Staphylococcus aureus VET1468S]